MKHIEYINKLISENDETADLAIDGGGLADEKGFTEKDADEKELDMGIDVELEHTSDEDMAKKITLDHLSEIPDYYTRLAKMEEEAFAELEEPEALEERKKKRKKKRKSRKRNLYRGFIGGYGWGGTSDGDGGDSGGDGGGE